MLRTLTAPTQIDAGLPLEIDGYVATACSAWPRCASGIDEPTVFSDRLIWTDIGLRFGEWLLAPLRCGVNKIDVKVSVRAMTGLAGAITSRKHTA